MNGITVRIFLWSLDSLVFCCWVFLKFFIGDLTVVSFGRRVVESCCFTASGGLNYHLTFFVTFGSSLGLNGLWKFVCIDLEARLTSLVQFWAWAYSHLWDPHTTFLDMVSLSISLGRCRILLDDFFTTCFSCWHWEEDSRVVARWQMLKIKILIRWSLILRKWEEKIFIFFRWSKPKRVRTFNWQSWMRSVVRAFIIWFLVWL